MILQTVTVFNLETNTSRFYEAVQTKFVHPNKFLLLGKTEKCVFTFEEQTKRKCLFSKELLFVKYNLTK